MIQERVYYAHTLLGRPPEDWQTLLEHLCGVAELASGFTEKFCAGEWGRIAGLLHDVGKYTDGFHQKLEKSGIK